MRFLLGALCITSLFAQNPQNLVVKTPVTVILKAPPVGYCLVEFYSIAIDQTSMSEWQCNKDTGIWVQNNWAQIGGLRQGTSTVPQMAGVNSGAQGALLCDDANGNATTSACSYVGITFSQISGVCAPAQGCTGTSTVFTQGSIPFVGSSGVYSQDNSNLFWNDSQDLLQIASNGVPSQNAITMVHEWVGSGNPDFGVNGSAMNWGALAKTISNSTTPVVTSPGQVDINSGDTVFIRSCTSGWIGLNGGPYVATVTAYNTFSMAGAPDTTGYGSYSSNGCVWEYRNYLKGTQVQVADGSTSSPISTNSPTLNFSRIDQGLLGDGSAAYRFAYKRIGTSINPGMSAIYLENRLGVPGGQTGMTIQSVNDQNAPTYSITACTAANPTVCTTSVAHNLSDNDTLEFSGGTGNWTPYLASNIEYLITYVSSTQFSIPLNSTGFGTLTGTVTATLAASNFAANFVAFMDGTGPSNGIAFEGTVYNGTGTDGGATDLVPHLLVPINSACQGSNKCSMGYLLQGNSGGGAGFINGVYFNSTSMSAGGYGINMGAATSMGNAILVPNAKWIDSMNEAGNSALRLLQSNSSNNTVVNSDGTAAYVSISNTPALAVTAFFSQIAATTYSELTACSSGLLGGFAAISDANTNTWGATVSSGGGNDPVMIFCDGVNWTVFAK